jgi:peptidoglycan/xylan/chitin deacetylase (PgdA/CDA1 family)
MLETPEQTNRTMDFRPFLRILSYHSISNLAGSELAHYGVAPDHFEHQINLLIETGYSFLDPNYLIDVVAGRLHINTDTVLITFDDCYSDFLYALPILQRYRIKALLFPVTRLIGHDNVWDNQHGKPRLQLLNARELLDIKTEGMAIGTHTRNHIRLTDLSDSQLDEEIKGSLEDLKALGLKPLPVLAYPYGSFNECVKKSALANGIQAAVTVVPGVVSTRSDPLQLSRIEVAPSDSGAEFLEKVTHLRVATKKSRLVGQSNRGEASDVTLVILSCGRYDLLDVTVRSFFRINQYPIREVLLSEDSGVSGAAQKLEEIFAPYDIPITFFINSRNQGINPCMDLLYSRVQTEFVLHLEDDWICTSTSGDFIQRARDVLSTNNSILQVWLRPPYDCNGWPLEDETLGTEYARYNLLKTGWQGKWHGYSNNPNLRRKREYLLLGPGGYSSMIKGDEGTSEAAIGQFYFERGFRAAVLVEPDAGFIHIGGARSVASNSGAHQTFWSSAPSMRDVCARLSLALKENQSLTREVQELRARLERNEKLLQDTSKALAR